jgi:hypothetical protein
MSILYIGARHLHLPVISMLPILHGFLVLEDERGQTTFSGDHGRGLISTPLLAYEASYLLEHADRHDVVVLHPAWTQIDAVVVLTSFRTTKARINALGLTYNPLNCNCNTVVTTLVLQAGLELPPPPALFLPGWGRSIP